MSEERRIRPALLLVLVGLVAAAGSGCRRDDPDELWYRRAADFAAGRLAEAETALARLARIRRLEVPERVLRARVASDRGRIDEALAALDGSDGPATGPEAAFIASRRGELESSRGHYRAAETELIRAWRLDPRRVEARRRLIMLYAQQGRSSDVAAHASVLAASEKPDFLDLYAWTLARNPPLYRAEVAEVLEKAVQADPDDRASRLALAECLRRTGRLEEAGSTLNALTPADAAARAARVRVALDRGDDAGAGALLTPDLDGDDPAELARLRGRLALGRGDASNAVRHYRNALEAAPEDRDTQLGLAQALLPRWPVRGRPSVFRGRGGPGSCRIARPERTNHESPE